MPALADPIEISVLSKEYVSVPFTAAVDPLLLGTVEMAFTTGHNDPPEAGEWKTAAVSGSSVRLLVGPGTTAVLAVGYYLVWVRLADASETPVEAVGYLRVY